VEWSGVVARPAGGLVEYLINENMNNLSTVYSAGLDAVRLYCEYH
jgi:hypothetical protein